MRAKNQKYYVYFAEAKRSRFPSAPNFLYKIGHSNNPQKRISHINYTDAEFELRLLHSFDFPTKKEACRVEREFQKILMSHVAFCDSREWFNDAPEVKNFFGSFFIL